MMMAAPTWIKHAVGGAVIGASSGKVINNYVKTDKHLSEDGKKRVKGLVIGLAEGGLVGYLIADKLYDPKKDNGNNQKVVGTLFGAACGVLVAYVINNASEQGKNTKK